MGRPRLEGAGAPELLALAPPREGIGVRVPRVQERGAVAHLCQAS
jgi:hypothetical protein